MKWLVYILIIPFCIASIPSDNYSCVWYGECDNNNGKIQNCVYNGTAKLINDTVAEEILRRRCPHFFNETGM